MKVRVDMKTLLKLGSKNIIGKNLKLLRKKKKLTQEQLAAKLELNNVPLDRIAISRIESGNRFVADYEVVELAKALKVEPEELLTAN